MRICCRRRRSTSAHSSRARSIPRRMAVAPFFSALRRFSTKRILSPLSCQVFSVHTKSSIVMRALCCWKLLDRRFCRFASNRSRVSHEQSEFLLLKQGGSAPHGPRRYLGRFKPLRDKELRFASSNLELEED